MKLQFFLFLLFFSVALQAQTKADAIVGVWYIPNEKADVEIYEENGKYYGKVTKGHTGPRNDVKNKDPKERSKSLVGRFILEDLVFDGKGTWENGTIYNPSNGKTYSCLLELSNKNKLKVTGYLGFSMFGKTQYWTNN